MNFLKKSLFSFESDFKGKYFGYIWKGEQEKKTKFFYSHKNNPNLSLFFFVFFKIHGRIE